MNHSPWLEQLRRTRPERTLENSLSTDIAIIGGGISGIMTAYFVLRHTEKRVVVIEGGLVGHGATGHNAGQVVSDFERSFREMVTQFGLEATSDAVAAIESAWGILEDLMRATNIQTPISYSTGYMGFSTGDQIHAELENLYWRKKGGLQTETLLIAEEAKEVVDSITPGYKSFFSTVPKANILSLLETDDSQYIATHSARRACVNSALLTETLAGYLLQTYADRFSLFEKTMVDLIDLTPRTAVISLGEGKSVKAKRVVLCTNGFEQLHIKNSGVNLDTKFHHAVTGTIGYMAGYLDPIDRPPTANTYFEQENSLKPYEPYFYLTRRPFEVEDKLKHNLVCAGGPEYDLEDLKAYDVKHEIPQKAADDLDGFLKRAYAHAPKGKIEYKYQWHGLMGYTPNRMRLIGPEPCNPTLMYNLGCNGIGILASIFGGKRIALMIAGKKLKPLLFDPQDMRCLIG